MHTEHNTSALSAFENKLREFLSANHAETTDDPIVVDVIYPSEDD